MPDKKTLQRVEQDKREGKSVSTQAGEFVREEMEHIREGKEWVRSTKQAIAIGLSNARRAGIALPAPKRGTTSEKTRRQAHNDLKAGQQKAEVSSLKPARVSKTALKKNAADKATPAKASSEKTKTVAKKRTSAERSAAARKAAHTRAQRQQSIRSN